jgi:hypothetical protein
MSNRERKPFPQWLKPDRFAITYGRPEGRPLQGIRVFPQPLKSCLIRSVKSFLRSQAHPVCIDAVQHPVHAMGVGEGGSWVYARERETCVFRATIAGAK